MSAARLRIGFIALVLFGAHITAASAQSVPSPWTAADVGSPALAGSTTYSSGVFRGNVGGSGFGGGVYGGPTDQFHFVYQRVSGDVDIITRVDSLGSMGVWSEAGVMIRTSLADNSAHATAEVTAGRGLQFARRTAAGGTLAYTAGPSSVAPVWLRASRVGTRVTTYYSSNGTSWTQLGNATIALGTTAYVGLAATSHNPSYRVAVAFSNVSVTLAGGALPSGQQSQDIGAPGVAGSATYSGGTYTIRGAGSDIWDAADQFRFVYQPVTGNVDVVARVQSITNQNAWSKAGVMVRESLTGPSAHAMMVTSVSKGYAFQRRPSTGAYSVNTSGGSGAPPGWVRLVRTGDLFEAYRSTDGSSWTRVGSDTIPMNQTVYVGIAVTSHNTSAATTAVVTNFRATAAPAGNQPPAVTLTAPANGAQITAPATVTMTATASDPEGRMASVDFYAGSTLIARDTTSPYSAAWAAAASGTYALTAVAHDADGGTTTSSTVNVSVQAANRAPTVSLTSPAAGASFTTPATVTLTASASDPENQLARVEFFSGSTRLASDTTAPYSFSWTNVAAGTYAVTAVAYDAAGAAATSAAVTVTVSTATSTAPRYVVFTASTNHATAVTNYVLRVFAAGANPSTATPIATSDLGKPTPAANNDITVDRGTFFSGLATGSYVATVTAVGSGGQTQSAAVSFTR